MIISLIIPTYNRRAILHRSLTAAIDQNYADFEVIVVDDASTDGTAEMIKMKFPQVRYFRQETNRGPAVARNRGIRESKGEIIAFTDDDCLVPPDFLSRLGDGYQRYPEVAGVGGYQEAASEVVAARLVARYERHMNRQVYHVGEQEYLGGFECPAGGTNSMSYRCRVLQEVGGFDETFPLAAGEDAYLKWQVVQQGHPLLFIPTQVVHLQDYTFPGFWKQQTRRGIGAAHFEWRRTGRYPRPFRIFLRIGKRFMNFFPGCFRMGVKLSFVHLTAGLADSYGQYIGWRHYRPNFEK